MIIKIYVDKLKKQKHSFVKIFGSYFRGQNRVRVTYNPESPQQMKKHFKGM